MKQNYIALAAVLIVLLLGVFLIFRFEGVKVADNSTTQEENTNSQDESNNDTYYPEDVTDPETVICVIGDDYSFTMKEFIDEMVRVMPQDFDQKMQQLSAPDQKLYKKKLEQDVMDFLVESGYVQMYFKDSGMEITPAEIEAEKEKTRQSLREQSGKPDLDVDAYFENLGVSDEMFSKDMYDQIMFQKVFSPVMDHVEVSDAEIKKYYDENITSFDVPSQADIDLIVAYKEDEVGKIMDEYSKGVDFGELALKYSQDPTVKDNKGAMGWVNEEQLPPEMIKHIFDDSRFENSDVIMFPIETVFYVLKRNDVKKAYTPTFDEIFDNVKQRALDAKKNDTYKSFLEEQKVKYGEPIITPGIVFPSDTVTSNVPPNTIEGMDGMIDQYMEEQKGNESP
ncbi:MAG: peptidyl-prolyl cis-trans isomerase [Caldisericia bacterium]|nr:peptidyl-prolyl cis-trans isomerase [Caldisericia bacterium]